MRHILHIALALLLLACPCQAQRGKKATAKKPKVEEPAEDPRIAQMLAATQQVVFVDSIVVDAADFMSHIPLSRHVGALTQGAKGGTFTSEMGDYRLTTTEKGQIAKSDFIANRWTAPEPIKGIGTEEAANPFLMPDGITLYYAQKGERSIGGYDIFVTRYDSEKAAFLKPENMGMPFASEANDIFYAIDEFNQLGYFVTDRRQPQGKVCIYIFTPQQTRRVYNSEAYSDEQMRSLAAIGRIADTWTDKAQRSETLKRLQAARTTTERNNPGKKGAKETELDALRHEAFVQGKALELLRNQYANANDDQKATLGIKILSSEKQLEELLLSIREKEKQIPYKQ